MSVVIRPGLVTDTDPVQKFMNHKDTIPMMGSFTMRSEIEGRYREGNESIPYHIVSEIDGETVACSNSKKQKMPFNEFGPLVVGVEHRRERLGTTMYAYHVARSMLSGQAFARDQTISINNVMQEHFLPFVGFKHMVKLRWKVRNFSSLNWWRLELNPESFDSIFGKIHPGAVFEGLDKDSDTLGDVFSETVERLEKSGRSQYVLKAQENREYVLKNLADRVELR